jgi:hypothetical protein
MAFVNRDRWAPLIDFSARWYQQALAPDDAYLSGAEQIGFVRVKRDRIGPPALREWFVLVGERVERGFLDFPDPTVFARWPARPRVTKTRLRRPDAERGLLPVLVCGDHGGWGLSVEDPSEDPPLHCLEEDGETSEPFPGTLSQLLTNAVVWETVRGDEEGQGPLGPLRAEVRRLEVASAGPRIRELLVAPRFQRVPFSLEGESFFADAEQTTLVYQDGGDVEVLTRSDAMWEELQGLLRRQR